MTQVFSRDGGRTWSKPIALEVGKVDPDLVLMSNGVLACSYGRPASCLIFSIDGGRSWTSHHVISEQVGFNYTSIREISPGRLLYFTTRRHFAVSCELGLRIEESWGFFVPADLWAEIV